MRHLTIPVNDTVNDADTQTYLILSLALVALLIIILFSWRQHVSQRYINRRRQQYWQDFLEGERQRAQHAVFLENARAAEAQRRQAAIYAQQIWKARETAEAHQREQAQFIAIQNATLESVRKPASYTEPSSSHAADSERQKPIATKWETPPKITETIIGRPHGARDVVQVDLESEDAETKVAKLRKLAVQSRKSRKEANKNLIAARKTRNPAAMRNWRSKIDQYDAEVIAYKKEAAMTAFKNSNPHYDTQTIKGLARCDLHGLAVEEATQYIDNHLKACKELGVGSTVVITGKGNRSKGGIAKIKPAIAEFLQKQQIEHEVGVPNDGCITVWTKDQNRQR